MDDSSIVLFANFDSANMARYERVHKQQQQTAAVNNSGNSSMTNMSNGATTAATFVNNTNSQNNESLNESNKSNSNLTSSNKNTSTTTTTTTTGTQSQQRFDIEFNVWTKQDCEDAPVGPNANRTWFYFGVRGGHGRWIRFNLMNLNKQGRLFEMGMLPVFRTVPGHENWSRIYTRPTWQNVDQNFLMSFVHKIPDKKESVTYFAFCFPYSYEDCQTQLQKYDEQFSYCKYLEPYKPCEPDAIYYHREVLCHSLDKRRIDLITISSCNNLSFKREPRFDPDNLFPNHETEKRCFRFDKKRVFVLTSRVHPGETPASFVFNGFLEFILRKDDTRARLLRQNFVFKLVPMLNPDGVFRGYYRTDQLGVNLNRVYLDPSFKNHPSIYAIKSLIIFHHINNRTSKEHDGLNFNEIFKLEYDQDDYYEVNGLNNRDVANTGETNQQNESELLTDEPTRISFKGIPSSDESKTARNLMNDKLKIKSLATSLIQTTSSPSILQNKNKNSEFMTFYNSANPQQYSLELKSPNQKQLTAKFNLNSEFSLRIKSAKSFEFLTRSNTLIENRSKNDDGQYIGNENSDEDEVIYYNRSNNSFRANASLPSATLTTNSQASTNQKNSPHLNNERLALINPLWSGVAFYVDLHGHAARRGCFIYGNSIDNELLQIENVLFAKLISFNSQHFDFDGCNFSVKNMYMKDKREGLSKEGSGRVAMFKTLGILHSYTLECCYASGRVMNTIAPAVNTISGGGTSSNFTNNRSIMASSGRISPPLHTDIPPKFLPEHYADVGKAVAIAALDIVEMNPFTRIPNTSFGSLESLRNWIKFFIKSKNGGGITNNVNSINTNVSNISINIQNTLPNNSTGNSVSSSTQINNNIGNFKKSNSTTTNFSKIQSNYKFTKSSNATTTNSLKANTNLNTNSTSSNTNSTKSEITSKNQENRAKRNSYGGVSNNATTSMSTTNNSYKDSNFRYNLGLNKQKSNLQLKKQNLKPHNGSTHVANISTATVNFSNPVNTNNSSNTNANNFNTKAQSTNVTFNDALNGINNGQILNKKIPNENIEELSRQNSKISPNLSATNSTDSNEMNGKRSINSSSSKKSITPPPFTSFKTTDLFNQLNLSLKFRSSASTSKSQQQQQQPANENKAEKSSLANMTIMNSNQLSQSTPSPLTSTKQSNPRKSNFSTDLKNLKLFDQVLIDSASINELKNMTKNHNDLGATSSNANESKQMIQYQNQPTNKLNSKKLLPLNKAAVFSTSGNSVSPAKANIFINTSTLINASNSSSLILLSKLNEQLISSGQHQHQHHHLHKLQQNQNINNKNKSSHLSSTNNCNSSTCIVPTSKLIDNLKKKQTNLLLDFNLDTHQTKNNIYTTSTLSSSTGANYINTNQVTKSKAFHTSHSTSSLLNNNNNSNANMSSPYMNHAKFSNEK